MRLGCACRWSLSVIQPCLHSAAPRSRRASGLAQQSVKEAILSSQPNSNGVFQDQISHQEVGRLAKKGAGATIVSGAMGLVMQILSTAVLARLLLPRDFGLVTMVTTFSLLIMNFGLNGFTEAIVQRAEITHALISNLFWINVSCCTALALGFGACGPWLAGMYGDPRIIGVARALSLTIFFTGLQVAHLALLKREMRFTAVSANDLVSRALSVLVSIVLALLGWEYWALVGGAIAIPVCSCVGAWILCRWVPQWPSRAPGTGAMVKFAVNIYGRFTTGYFTNNVDNFLVGWRLGAVELGYYKKAYDLFILSSNQLSSGLTIVAVSALRRLLSDPEQYRRYLLNALSVMTFIGMGISGVLTLTGRDLIFVVMGPRWHESGQLFTFFSPGIGFMLLYFTHVWIHLSLGRPDRWFRWGFVDLVVTTLLLFAGVHWRAQGVAIAWGVSYLLITFPALWYAGRPIHLKITPIVSDVGKYLSASLLAYAAAFSAFYLFPRLQARADMGGAITRLGLGATLFAVVYLALVVAIYRSTAPVRQLLGLARELVSRNTESLVSGELESSEAG